jgi:hypothetical protein
MKKLIYAAILTLGLIGSIAADGPWPPNCFPHCDSKLSVK